MKYVISKIINTLSFVIIGLIFLLIIFLILFNFFDSRLEKNHKKIEYFISEIIKHPISFVKINSSNNGLDPVLKLNNIIIYDKTKTKKIIEAQEFQISIDLIGSLLSWRIKPGLLTMSGVNLFFIQDKNITTSPASSSNIKAHGIQNNCNIDMFNFNNFKEFYWLFEQNKIYLKNTNIKLQLINGQFIEFNDLKLKLYNDSLHHKLKISGVFLQKNIPAKFDINLKLRILSINSYLDGFIKIEDLILNVSDKIDNNNDLFIIYNLIPLCGNINIFIKNSQITSNIFTNVMPIDNFSSNIFWKNIKNSEVGFKKLRREIIESINININDINFSSGDLEFFGDVKISSPTAKFDPIINADINFFLENLNKAKLYYPVKLMPKNVIFWLNNAFISSNPMFGKVVFKGAASKFPFDNKEGVFFVDANINNVHLNYDKDWPKLENITGKLIFFNRSMEIFAHKAKIMQSRINSIKAFILDLNRPILSIKSDINSESQLGLKFINFGPLKISIGEKLKYIDLHGQMKLDLKLLIPLYDSNVNSKTEINGNITLINNYLSSKNFNFNIKDLNGELYFTKDSLFAKNVHGELFKHPVNIDIDTINTETKDVLTKIVLNGMASAKNIADGFNIKVGTKIKGTANYKALFEIHNTLIENSFLRIDSDLQGISIDLPEPLFKNSNSIKKSSFIYFFSKIKTPKTIIKYSDQIVASLDKNKNLSVNFNKLDVSLWNNYLLELKNSSNNKFETIFNKLTLKINKLNAFGQTLSNALFQIDKNDKNLQINITALPEIKGSIYINKNQNLQIKGIFEQLHIKSIDGAKKFTSNINPQNVVPLDFIIENFSYNDKNFNKIYILTKPQPNGLEISKLNIDNSDFTVRAHGSWIINGVNKQQTNLYGNLHTQNAGNLLNNLDLNSNVIGGIGATNFELNWPQAPYNFNLKNLMGKFTVELKKGYIVNLDRKTEIKLGVGKALNALSLRHLSLNISDITKKGLKFDKFNVDAFIKDNNINIKSLKLEGPIVRVLASGLIDLVGKDYNMYVNVIPHITSSVPIAATFAAGPIIGLLSWVVADVVVASVIKKATTYKYHVTGKWNDPIMEKIK